MRMVSRTGPDRDPRSGLLSWLGDQPWDGWCRRQPRGRILGCCARRFSRSELYRFCLGSSFFWFLKRGLDLFPCQAKASEQVLQGPDGQMQHDGPPYNSGDLVGRQATRAPGHDSSSARFIPCSFGAMSNRPCAHRVLGPTPVPNPMRQASRCLHAGGLPPQRAFPTVVGCPPSLPPSYCSLTHALSHLPSACKAEGDPLFPLAEEQTDPNPCGHCGPPDLSPLALCNLPQPTSVLSAERTSSGCLLVEAPSQPWGWRSTWWDPLCVHCGVQEAREISRKASCFR